MNGRWLCLLKTSTCNLRPAAFWPLVFSQKTILVRFAYILLLILPHDYLLLYIFPGQRGIDGDDGLPGDPGEDGGPGRAGPKGRTGLRGNRGEYTM